MVLMIGTSEQCESGAHQDCRTAEGLCRCGCHKTTQELLRTKTPQPAAPRQAPVHPKNFQPQASAPEKRPNKPNRCPKCKKKYPKEENFCRRDGAKLDLGTLCQRCGESTNAPDGFCWRCGQNLKEGMATESTSTPITTVPVSVRPMLPALPALPPPPNRSTLDVQSRRNLPTVDGDPLNGQPAPLPHGVVAREIPLDDETDPNSTPAEDTLLRLRRQAKELGLLPKGGVTTTATSA